MIAPPPPGGAIDWRAIEDALDAVVPARELERTPQDAAFHSEGDVWTHTKMVAEAMAADDDFRALPEAERAIVFTAAVAHDVGKPSTTRIESDGKITSRGHSARGDQLVRAWLWRLGVPFADREQVCRLIGSHQVPFFAFGRDNAAHTAETLSLRLRNDFLALVALADARGRRCAQQADQDRIVENTLLYRELCRELGVLDGPRAFASDHTRVVWRETQGRRRPEVLAFDDCACEVTVMSGLPASGKDWWLATQRPGLPVVSLDAVREALDVEPGEPQGGVAHAAREAARDHLRNRRDFAWNATNLSAQLRGQVVQLAREYGARIRLVYCEAPPAVIAARNRERRDPVPADAMNRMIARWSVPLPDEAHSVTYAIAT